MNNQLRETLTFYLPKKPSDNSRAVLGKDIMEAVWSDMKLMQLPTWVGSNWGTAKRGKLTANHW